MNNITKLITLNIIFSSITFSYMYAPSSLLETPHEAPPKLTKQNNVSLCFCKVMSLGAGRVEALNDKQSLNKNNYKFQFLNSSDYLTFR